MVKQITIGLMVMLPIGAALILPLYPRPVVLSNARKQLNPTTIESDSKLNIAALETELSFEPWKSDNWLRLGRLRLNNGDYEGAVNAFYRVDFLTGLQPEGKLWLADALISNGEPLPAREILREFSILEQVDDFTYLQAAQMQRSLKDTYGALVTLLRAYEFAPLNAEINFQIGLQLSATDPDEALPFLERVGTLNPAKLPVSSELMKIIEESAKAGSDGTRFIMIGQELAKLVEWDIAQRAFERAVELEPQNGVAWALLAESAQQNGENGQAFITRAQELSPDTEFVNGLSGLYYRRQGKPELALIYLEKALAANPGAYVWEMEIAATLDGMGDLAGALAQYQSAVAIDPQHWLPWRSLAVFCITRNYQLEEIGLPAARRALELNEGSPALMDLLGTALMMVENYEGAENYFLMADAIDPNQSAILIHLGQLHLAMGDETKAREYLMRALEYARDSRLREMAIRLLDDNQLQE